MKWDITKELTDINNYNNNNNNNNGVVGTTLYS